MGTAIQPLPGHMQRQGNTTGQSRADIQGKQQPHGRFNALTYTTFPLLGPKSFHFCAIFCVIRSKIAARGCVIHFSSYICTIKNPNNTIIMKELVAKINALTAAFAADAEKSVAGNKAAGARARKTSLEIEKALKEYRKASIEATK